MIAVGLKVLKNKLSEYVRRAAAGETILITDRERVVAELVPPRETRAETISDTILAQAVRDGSITPAAFGPGDPPATTGAAPLREILAGLDDDRRDR
ncbi:MAG: type II toxin-antitoxin system Phd/YefM family antitoxin [Actinomycetota bacterium]